MLRFRSFTGAAVVALLLASGCSDAPSTPPVLPYRTAVLQSPSGAEGAAVLEVDGAPFLEVTADGSELHVGTDGAVTRIVVLRADPGEIRFRVRMDPAAPDPAVRVVQVAAPDDALRPDLAGYQVRFTAVDR
jgi:hypothetical protein